MDLFVCSVFHGYSDLPQDGILVENMHDVPYMRSHQCHPGTIAAMAVVCHRIRQSTLALNPRLYYGVQILAGANRQALAVAHASGYDFIRAEAFVYGHVADEGYIDACAGELLRDRRILGAESVAVIADVKKKHS